MPKYRHAVTGGVRESTRKLGFPWEPYTESKSSSSKSSKSSKSKSSEPKRSEGTEGEET